MKKIFTFLFCTVIISLSFAQTNKHGRDEREPDLQYYGTAIGKRYFDEKNNLIRERNQEIREINFENDSQVQNVINNDDFDIWQKRDILNNLESQRIRDVNSIYQKYRDEISYYSNKEKINSYKPAYHNYEVNNLR